MSKFSNGVILVDLRMEIVLMGLVVLAVVILMKMGESHDGLE